MAKANYEKYDNIIVSSTEPTIKPKIWIQTGKNLFNGKGNNVSYSVRNIEKENYTIINANKIQIKGLNQSWSRATLVITNLKPNTQYTMSAYITNENNHNAGLYTEYNGNNVKSMSADSNFYSTITFTTDSVGKIEIQLFSNWSGTSLTETVVYDNIQLEEGINKSSYEAFVESKMHILNDNNTYEDFIPEQKKIYSTNENVIGQWINGKTLYSKTCTGTVSSVTQQITDFIIDELIDYKGNLIIGGNQFVVGKSEISGDNDSRVIKSQLLGGYVRLDTNPSFNGSIYSIVIEYTKP